MSTIPHHDIVENKTTQAAATTPAAGMATTPAAEEFGTRDEFVPAQTSPTYAADAKRSSIEKYGNGFEEAGSGKSTAEEEQEPPSKFSLFYRRYRLGFHIAIAALVTAWYIAALVLHRDEARVVPTLIWAFIILKLFFYHVSTRHFTPVIAKVWNMTFGAFFNAIPAKLKIPLGAFTVLAVFLLAGFLTPVLPGQSLAQRGQAFFGILVFLGLLISTSSNIRAINWRTVLVGLFLQFVVALFVLRTGVGQDIFRWLANEASIFLSFSEAGYSFLFSASNETLGYFIIAVIPAVIFFVAFVQLLYYWGVMQWVIKKFAWFMLRTMDVSGAEAVVAAASPFIGQGENAVLVLPYVPLMTKSEIHQIMTSGFATISGSVLFGYIKLGVPADQIITACVMSVPASLAVSKIRFPETEEPLTRGRVVIPPQDPKERPVNFLDALGKGAILGGRIAFFIILNLLVIVSVVAFINSLMGWVGHFFQVPQLSLNFLAGYIFYPFAWLLSIPNQDLYIAGQLLGEKLIQNEFVAYNDMTSTYKGQITDRTVRIITYALCGFANLSSIGIQIGILTSLAPTRGKDVARLAASAMLCGMLSTYMTAAIAGMLS